jgi:leukotriene-A4 hydrolase
MEDLCLKANDNDVSTYSNFHHIRQEKINLKVQIDLTEKKVFGHVDITFKILSPDEQSRLILDCKSVLVKNVTYLGQNLNFWLYDENPDKEALGTPLVILLPKDIQTQFTLTIEFASTEESAAIQWLEANQTLSKNYPFMFTQCEAILARTLIPCQDTPSAKVQVTASLTVRKPLVALFSGIQTQTIENGDYITYEYEQKIPVATYLIAIACGELEYGKLSERCGIWTEVGLRDKAVWEFANTEQFLTTAENYLTPYVWGVYNILVLPMAFPYGGMENPCLTFVTNALLAGDRSMTNVIAHEIAHSWTGNLVTNKDWGNFWMNEGFTTFMERKICELVNGEEMALLEANVGKDELKAAIESIGENHNYTSLAPNFSNVDPDDGFSVVPYEKGFTFVYYLESLVGKQNFQLIMQNYIKKFSLHSVSHKDFRKIFEDSVRDMYGDQNHQILNLIDWDAWINTTGYPIKNIEFKSKLVEEANNFAEEFLTNNIGPDAKQRFLNYDTMVKSVVLAYIKDNINRVSDQVYTNLRDILGLHSGYNAEIGHLWYPLCLKLGKEDAIEHVKTYLLNHGRMKYIRPVYYSWYPFQKEACLDFFDKHK